MNENGRQALILIDLQKDLCYDQRRAHLVEAAIPPILSLQKAFHQLGLPIFYTKFELPPDDPQFQRFGDSYCIKGTTGADFIDEIQPIEGVIIAKKKHSAFFGTDLEARLRTEGVSEVVLCGLQTQICILTTAADAHHMGFSVIAASDCVVSTRDEVRLEALDWIAKYVGMVRTSQEIKALL